MSSKPLYGLIKWIGNLPDQKEPKKLIAGLEMVIKNSCPTLLINHYPTLLMKNATLPFSIYKIYNISIYLYQSVWTLCKRKKSTGI